MLITKINKKENTKKSVKIETKELAAIFVFLIVGILLFLACKKPEAYRLVHQSFLQVLNAPSFENLAKSVVTIIKAK